MESNSSSSSSHRVLNKLNTILAFDKKPIIKFDNLEINKRYRVFGIKIVNTKFGNKLLVETDMNKIFLPERFNIFDDNEIQQLNILCEKVFVMEKYDNHNLHFE